MRPALWLGWREFARDVALTKYSHPAALVEIAMDFKSALLRIVHILLLGLVGNSAAQAQFPGTPRVTSPNGRAVLEIRRGTQPANANLLFTAVITAGPISGSTSLMLQQSLVRDLFNPGAPAAGWTVVRSSITAFSLGGGCGRNNLIDFPFINANRPEILRITGTTQQVITLGIPGSDQYDSIDCVMQRDGRVLYMLTNRTRRTLEFRREQGGLMVLVRDNFGNVITPFVGGMRPSITRIRRFVAPIVPSGDAPQGGTGILREDFVAFFLPALVTPQQYVGILRVLDDDSLTEVSHCDGPVSSAPTGFTIPRESAVADGVAVGSSRNDNSLWGDYFSMGDGGCTQTTPGEVLGSAGPFSLYNWGGVAANHVYPGVNGSSGSGRVAHTTLLLPAGVIVLEGNQRHDLASPFANRGGPLTSCAIGGSEFDAAQLAIGVGANTTQVQHQIIPINLQETIAGSSFEDPWDSASRCQ